jgi:hypothetical protein
MLGSASQSVKFLVVAREFGEQQVFAVVEEGFLQGAL